MRRWSSYATCCVTAKPLAWLHDKDVLAEFGNGVRGRREYREYVAAAVRSGGEASP